MLEDVTVDRVVGRDVEKSLVEVAVIRKIEERKESKVEGLSCIELLDDKAKVAEVLIDVGKEVLAAITLS